MRRGYSVDLQNRSAASDSGSQSITMFENTPTLCSCLNSAEEELIFFITLLEDVQFYTTPLSTIVPREKINGEAQLRTIQ